MTAFYGGLKVLALSSRFELVFDGAHLTGLQKRYRENLRACGGK